MPFVHASKMSRIRPIIIVAYGEPGVGKSYLWGTFPEPIYVIDMEKRAKNTAQDFFPDKDIFVDSVWKTKFNRYKKRIDDPIETLISLDTALEELGSKDLEDVTTVVFDGATKIRAFCTAEYLHKAGLRHAFGVKAFTAINERMLEFFNTVIAYGRDFDKHVVITTQRKADYQPTGVRDPQGNMQSEQVGWEAGLKDVVGHAVDLVAYFRFVNTPWGKVRVASFDKHSIIGSIPVNLGFVDFTYQDMMKVHASIKYNKKHVDEPRVLTKGFNERQAFDIFKLPTAKQNCLICGAAIIEGSNYCLLCGERVIEEKEAKIVKKRKKEAKITKKRKK